jgi:hypothetical protein
MCIITYVVHLISILQTCIQIILNNIANQEAICFYSFNNRTTKLNVFILPQAYINHLKKKVLSGDLQAFCPVLMINLSEVFHVGNTLKSKVRQCN